MFRRSISWDWQPQETLRIDPSHPLAPFVLCAWVGSSPYTAQDAVLTASSITSVIGPRGIATRFGAYASSSIINLPVYVRQRLVGSPGSVIAGLSIGTLGATTFPHIFSIRDSGTQILTFSLGLDAGSYTGGRVALNVGTDLIGTSGSARQNAYAVYGAEWGDSRALYVDGVLNASDASTNTPAANSITPALGNRQTGARALNGDLEFCFIFNAKIGAEWQAKLAIDPWQLVETRKVWTPISITSAGTTYTITPAGGVSFGGTGTEKNRKRISPTGGVVFSGTGNMTKGTGVGTTYTITPSGGVVFSGNGLLRKRKILLPTGGITFSGTGNERNRKRISPVGGVLFGGTGNMISNTTPISTGKPGERTKVGTGT